ncbi:MAG: SpoIID/LytB domain-containing protein [Chloroflexi bacterium]|nr:SpoIID/LytB domain-containing protein [Chloroflexota bacterium]
MRRLTRRAFLVGAGLALAGTVRALQTASAQTPPPAIDTACSAACGGPIVVESNLADLETVRALAVVDLGNISNLLTRVTISTTDFASQDHDDAWVTADGTFDLVDKATNAVIASNAAAGAGYSITNTNNSGKLRVLRDNVVLGSTYTGPVLVQPLDPTQHDSQHVQVTNASHYGYAATYRGYLEVAVSSTAGKVKVTNVLDPNWFADPLEKYLYGVVPGEMPSGYPLEALKAQAVAARCYAASRWDGAAVSLCDSTSCQIYYGYPKEWDSTRQAVNDTRGVVATYAGSVISAMYSSTCGGHTEDNANVYTGSQVPYLHGVRCYDDGSYPDLSDGNLATVFWKATATQVPSFCDGSRTAANSNYRWTVTWTRAQLEALIRAYLPTANPSPPFDPNQFGTLQELRVMARGVSGKIKTLRFVNTAGSCWEINGDYNVRKVLRNDVGATVQRSSNMILEHNPTTGLLVSVTAYAGGYGHGVGMCQRGAEGMAARGLGYADILRHYYTGIDLTLPAPTPLSPANGALVLSSAVVTLTWQGVAAEYYAELSGPSSTLTRDWSSSASWAVGNLPVGAYQWHVRGRNSAGEGPYCAWQRLISTDHIYKTHLPYVVK